MSFKNDAVIVEANGLHTSSVIWLHGLGACGRDFLPVIPELGVNKNTGVRFVFPNAPMRPVTINGNRVMRAWYDVRAQNLGELEDKKSIVESAQLIQQYIEAEIEKGVKADNIILAGFSQGGAIALYAGIRQRMPLAGLIALSTYLPCPDESLTHTHQDTPILMAHGITDPVIPVAQGRASSVALRDMGYQVEWLEYAMEHAVCTAEILKIGAWINQALS